ncbi:hypothetical protein HGRIS_011032 [Hohenbuehelia grisea]|uniref:G domain-containing protein n=1 Tax=Hohenbuehelia grisea TaxID=104357 RepID=A0ABR3IYW1_9AGAR
MSPFSPAKKKKTQKHVESQPPVSVVSVIGKFWNAISSKTAEVKTGDVIIAVVGPTGAGKSSFIKAATGHGVVGEELRACTSEVEVFKLSWPERSLLDVVFVDTPGTNDYNISDTKVLEMITQWLKITYERNTKLTAILYLHRISDNRMAGTPLGYLKAFEKLCGQNALRNIAIITTMWDEVDPETGEKRIEELRDKYWNVFVSQGAKIKRHDQGSEASAWKTIDAVLQAANKQYSDHLLQELAGLKKQLSKQDPGHRLYTRVETLVMTQQEILLKIRGAMENDTDASALESKYNKSRENLEEAVREIQSMKILVGEYILRLVSAQLGCTRIR